MMIIYILKWGTMEENHTRVERRKTFSSQMTCVVVVVEVENK